MNHIAVKRKPAAYNPDAPPSNSSGAQGLLPRCAKVNYFHNQPRLADDENAGLFGCACDNALRKGA